MDFAPHHAPEFTAPHRDLHPVSFSDGNGYGFPDTDCHALSNRHGDIDSDGHRNADSYTDEYSIKCS